MKVNKENQIVIGKDELNVVPLKYLVWFFNGHRDNHHKWCKSNIKKEILIEGIKNFIPYDEFVLCKGTSKIGKNQILIGEDTYRNLIIKVNNLPTKIMLKDVVIEDYKGKNVKVFDKNGKLIFWEGSTFEELIQKRNVKQLTIRSDGWFVGDRTWFWFRFEVESIEDWKEIVETIKGQEISIIK